MQTLPVQQVRQGWRAALDAARFHRTATVITYHDEPVAVLMPPDGDRSPNAAARDGSAPVAEEVGAGEARARLRELVDAARDGRSATIVRHGLPVARLVSYTAEPLLQR